MSLAYIQNREYTPSRPSFHKGLFLYAETMLQSREIALPDIFRIVLNSRAHHRAHIGKLLGELRYPVSAQAQNIFRHQDLPIAGRRCTDAYSGHRQRLGNASTQAFRNAFLHRSEEHTSELQ